MKINCSCVTCVAYLAGFEHGRRSVDVADALTAEAEKLGLYPKPSTGLPRFEPGARVACTDRRSAYFECAGTVREVRRANDGTIWYSVDWDGWANPCDKRESDLEPVCALCNAPASRHPSSFCPRNVSA